MKTLAQLCGLFLLLYLTSCATITRGSNEAFVIETSPIGADVTVTHEGGFASCTTPCSVRVKRRGQLLVTVKKEGYKDVTTTVQSSIDGGGGTAMAGNVLLGGIIGAGVDAGSGAMHSHKPNPLVLELEPLESQE